MVYCIICDQQFENFEEYGVPPRQGQCANCGGKPRHRALLYFLANYPLTKESEVMEIGPSKVATKYILKSAVWRGARYTAIDNRALRHHKFIKKPHRFFAMDAVKLDFADRSFDLILCNNVLPFTSNDLGVLREIQRCLKPGGTAMINVERIEGIQNCTPQELQAMDPEKYNDDFLLENCQFHVYGDNFAERVAEAGLVVQYIDAVANIKNEEKEKIGLKDQMEFILATHK